MALNEKQLELRLCPIGFELLQEENPVSASRSGGNTVFHYCDALDIRASYAGCLHTLEAIADGRGHLRPECEAAYISGTCPAVQMRKMELRADKALFFVSYHKLMAEREARYVETESVVRYGRQRGNTRFKPTEIEATETVEVVTKKPETEEIQTNIMEQVLKKKVANGD